MQPAGLPEGLSLPGGEGAEAALSSFKAQFAGLIGSGAAGGGGGEPSEAAAALTAGLEGAAEAIRAAVARRVEDRALCPAGGCRPARTPGASQGPGRPARTSRRGLRSSEARRGLRSPPPAVPKVELSFRRDTRQAAEYAEYRAALQEELAETRLQLQVVSEREGQLLALHAGSQRGGLARGVFAAGPHGGGGQLQLLL